MALGLLSKQLEMASKSLPSLLFPARGSKSKSDGSPRTFNGWSKAKTALDKLSGVTDWTLHDLRRTYATNMARLGCPPHIIEALLNHATGQISGVAAIYNRHSYLDEARPWVEKYEAHIQTLLGTV
jgi:integrase